jgi:hypothetical protein
MPFTKYLNPSKQLTISTSAYTAEDVIGGLLTFDLTGLSENGGLINSALITDADNEKAALRLYLFESVPAVTTVDADPFAITVVDMAKLVADIRFATASYVSVGTDAFCLVEDINNAFVVTNNILYGYLVCTATPTYAAATDLKIVLHIEGQ